MVYYKLILDERRLKEDQIYPVIIRITHNRKNSSLATGVRVRKPNWNSNCCQIERSEPNYQQLNLTITEFYIKVQKLIHQLETECQFSFETLKERLSPTPVMRKPIVIQPTVASFAAKLIKEMFDINKAGNALIYRTASNRFLNYCNNANLLFNEVDYILLEGFRNHLISSKVKQNTISNYFRTIRAIYNKAIKAKIVDRSSYPFLDIPIKVERTAKRAINIKELKALAILSLKEQSPAWHARNYFMFSFALRGASFTDVAYLKVDNIRKGYIVYRRRKTGKELRVKIFPFTKQLINTYKTNSKYLFPILSDDVIEDSLQAKNILFQWIKTSNKYINRLGKDCKIEEDITSYVTRHTFATIAKKKFGYSNEVIAECLGHEYGNKITNTYLDSYDQSLIDEVNERLINLINS
jgi:integrase/recombinase XerD